MVSRVFCIKVWMEYINLGDGYQIEKSSICNILSKRSLMTTDIFLFDQKIKNGRTLAAKFYSKELKFHTPNVVIVFSNERPEIGQLSKDRWKIFQIRDEELLDATDKYV